ncbi:MAG TPA: fluoride efflux transporter CrcB [Mycobacteriales bacterium]|jgi:CrcB protein|nr:fluoride efflux transporter CrcB [Mycobacteriales bacterium]
MTVLLVCLGAALGAPARYLTDRAIQSRHGTSFPWGTFTVNVVGSLVLGVLAGVAAHHAVPPAVVAALGTGFCGALTTYSAFGYDTVRLAESGARVVAVLNVVASLTAGLGAAALGYAAGTAL